MASELRHQDWHWKQTMFSPKCQMVAWSQAACALATLVDSGPLCPLHGVWAFWEETNARMAWWKSFDGTLAELTLAPCTKRRIMITLLENSPPPAPSTSPGVLACLLASLLHCGLWGEGSVWGKVQIIQESPAEDKEKERNTSSSYLSSVPVKWTHRGSLFSSLCSRETINLQKKNIIILLSVGVLVTPSSTDNSLH